LISKAPETGNASKKMALYSSNDQNIPVLRDYVTRISLIRVKTVLKLWLFTFELSPKKYPFKIENSLSKEFE